MNVGVAAPDEPEADADALTEAGADAETDGETAEPEIEEATTEDTEETIGDSEEEPLELMAETDNDDADDSTEEGGVTPDALEEGREGGPIDGVEEKTALLALDEKAVDELRPLTDAARPYCETTLREVKTDKPSEALILVVDFVVYSVLRLPVDSEEERVRSESSDTTGQRKLDKENPRETLYFPSRLSTVGFSIIPLVQKTLKRGLEPDGSHSIEAVGACSEVDLTTRREYAVSFLKTP